MGDETEFDFNLPHGEPVEGNGESTVEGKGESAVKAKVQSRGLRSGCNDSFGDATIFKASKAMSEHNQLLRKNLAKTANDLREFTNYLVQLVDNGTLALRDAYDDPQCRKFEDFVEPQTFTDLISTLQWQSVDSAQNACTFESIHVFLRPIVEARSELLKSVIRLERKAYESPPRSKPFLVAGAHDEEEKRPKKRKKTPPGTEELFLAANEDNDSILNKINEEVTRVLKPSLKRLRGHVEAWKKEWKLVPKAQRNQYNLASEEARINMLRELFVTAMGKDKQHLNAKTYEGEMKRIRALRMWDSFEDLGSRLEQLESVVTDLESFASSTTLSNMNMPQT